MIEQQAINGRSATIAYLSEDFEPVDKEEASLAKIIFEDGELLFVTIQKQDKD